MNNHFVPDYTNLLDAAYNRRPNRIPLYEHIIDPSVMERIMGEEFKKKYNEGYEGKKEYFTKYVQFFKMMGYDTVTYEACITDILVGGGALSNKSNGCIHERADFEKYNFDEIPQLYRQRFYEDLDILREVMPQGMKCVGGVGNGVFECVQDLIGYQNLCYLKADDETLYEDLFHKVGRVVLTIWKEFVSNYSDIYCVLRFGDDLGFQSDLLISKEDVERLILPHYKKIVEVVHEYDKPFLLHSCGQITSIMERLIQDVKIDAKHSNEDKIAPYKYWVDTYGDQIGNFGGIDLNFICIMDEEAIRRQVREVFSACKDKGGFAVGTGNSVPDYVDIDKYKIMVEEIRKCRGESVYKI